MKRKYHVDDLSFDQKYENINMAYWLGFLAADGNIHSKENSISLFLQQKDYKHIEKLSNYLNSSYPIRIYKENNSCGFLFNNKKIKKDLSYYNIVPKKSLVLEPPILLKDENFSHFIRGYFDGDGCISCPNNNFIKIKFSILGTYNMLLWISKIFNEKIFLKFKKPRKTKDNIYELSFSGRKNCQKIYNFLYQNSNKDIFLERKQKKFFSFIENYKFLELKKAISKFDLNYKYIESYTSISEAERKNNISIDYLRKQINKNKEIIKGYRWKFNV